MIRKLLLLAPIALASCADRAPAAPACANCAAHPEQCRANGAGLAEPGRYAAAKVCPVCPHTPKAPTP